MSQLRKLNQYIEVLRPIVLSSPRAQGQGARLAELLEDAMQEVQEMEAGFVADWLDSLGHPGLAEGVREKLHRRKMVS